MKKYLISGNKGQLGKEFEKRLSMNGEEFYGFDIDTVDIANIDQVLAVYENIKPEFVINCAAYNQVDLAEKSEYDAYKANVLGIRNLAIAAEKYGGFVVHYSTDYVFDGTKGEPYTEIDEPNPLNVYAKSKLLGEMALEDETDSYLLFRVSWLFGDGNQNFIYKFLQWSRNNEELQIANDEISVPTHTGLVVDCTLKALNNSFSGMYHLTGSGYCSRYEWAEEIVKLANLKNKVIPVSKEIFNLPAKRPDFSAMNNYVISNELKIDIPDWKETLEHYLEDKILLV